MKKIGILLESTNCSKYLYETVNVLANSNQIEFFFLINSKTSVQQGVWQSVKSKIKNNGLLRTVALVFFKLVTTIEYRILSVFFQDVRDHKKILNIDEYNNNETVFLNPGYSASGLIVRYSDEDIFKIKSLDLDIIIRGNAPGIFKGDIINSAKDGIVSFHHGDNRWNRGGPPAYWEVYLRKPSTGFIIQILTEELDGGSVLFRGNIQTKRSYIENIVNLYNVSNPYLAKILLQYANSNKLPTPEEKLPFGGSLLMIPSFTQSISYLSRTGFLYISLVVKRLVLRKNERWSVAFIKAPWRYAILRKGVQIKNPPKRFFADPFVITKDEKTICYVEDYCYKKKRACITAIEIIDNNKYLILDPVIEEPFHMSFPFLFEYQQELYMVPETSKSNSVRLYKCVEFPLKWEYQKDILRNVSVVDSMIFEFDGKWWLLCNMAIGGKSDHSSTLMAFYSENPLSDDWTAHELNPLIFDSNIARNGGILDFNSSFPIRARQKQGFNLYGTGLTLAKINNLTPSSFSEEVIGQISPEFFKKIKGCHHIHSNGNYTVYDYLRSESLK